MSVRESIQNTKMYKILEIESTRCRVFNRKSIIILFRQLYAQKLSCTNAIFVTRFNLSRSIVCVHEIRMSQQMSIERERKVRSIPEGQSVRGARRRKRKGAFHPWYFQCGHNNPTESNKAVEGTEEESEREKWRNVAWWEQFRRDEMQSRRERRQGTDQRDRKPERGRKWRGGILWYFSVESLWGFGSNSSKPRERNAITDIADNWRQHRPPCHLVTTMSWWNGCHSHYYLTWLHTGQSNFEFCIFTLLSKCELSLTKLFQGLFPRTSILFFFRHFGYVHTMRKEWS